MVLRRTVHKKRTNELYDNLVLTPLITQIKRIEVEKFRALVESRSGGGMELITEKVKSGEGLPADEIDDIFGESGG